jgi:hypothetical protein
LADTFDDGISEEPIVYPDEGDLLSNAGQEYADSEWTLRTNGWIEKWNAMREELYEFLLKKDDAVIACSCEEVQSMQMECVSLRSN